MSSDNDNIGGAALGVCWALSAIAMVITTACLYTQAHITRQLGLSDALLVISTGIVLTFASIITVQYHYGWGRHQALLSQHDRIQALKYNAIGQTFGVLGSTFGCLSTITTLINLFGITQRLRGDNTVTLFTWVLTKAVLLNIAASAPILRPLYKRLLGKEPLDSSYEMYYSYATKTQVSHGRTSPRYDDSTSDKVAILNKESLHRENYYNITVNQSYSVAVGDVYHP
ncbi:hypothetical protein N7449_004017 [Penicillium cf. viridicatum]|uniref:Uncharacterized protein n=1 Tax=Penicillium cf. viridicatum TaxID=2972119 RepID=A0A9W9MY07_9EURO|nr:hypothetical protein N7449_004017 [Penicillium cf. viridicatum]